LSLLASLLSDFPQPARASAPAAPVPTSTPRRLTTTSVTTQPFADILNADKTMAVAQRTDLVGRSFPPTAAQPFRFTSAAALSAGDGTAAA
jgi:hypothetical protein